MSEDVIATVKRVSGPFKDYYTIYFDYIYTWRQHPGGELFSAESEGAMSTPFGVVPEVGDQIILRRAGQGKRE